MIFRLGVSLWLSFWFVLVYNGCNYLASLRPEVGHVAFWWERFMPFFPVLIIPYWSIDLLFVLAPFFCRSDFLLRQHLKRVTLGIAIAGFFFLNFPLTLAFQRPPVEGFLGKLFSSLETMNNFYNCAPSLHIVLRTNLWPIYVTPARGMARIFIGLWFFSIGLSTLFCWQHHLVDVFTGQLLGLFCLFVLPSVPFVRPFVDRARGINARSDIALRYSLGALGLWILCWSFWYTSVLLLWPALSLSLVAAAYWGMGPTFLRKYQGRQLQGARWLLNPYRWVSQWTASYFNAGQPAYAEAQPGLFVGRRLNQQEALALPVEAVLDLTAEYDEVPAFLERTYLNLPVLDLTAPSLDQLRQGVEFVRAHPNCYIHCSLGLGRSVTFLVAYWISQGQSLGDALTRAQQVRPRLRLTQSHLQVLEEFAQG